MDDGLDSPHVGGVGFDGLCVLCCFALEERLESAEEDVSDDVDDGGGRWK
jgi:hypothetical protein